MHQPRGARGGERSRRQYFYVHQDYCIQQASRRYQYDLDRQDFRQLDAAGNQRYINGVAQVYETYGADWSQLCAEVPALAAVVPVAKGGNKGRGKGKGKPAEPKQAGKGQGQQEAPGVANPKAKPQAIPKADPKLPAAGAPPPKARDTPGTPAVAKATPLGGGESGSGASSSGGLPVAAPKAEGAAPPAEPKSAAPEPAPAASGESDAPESAPAAPDTEEKAPEPTADEPAPLTAAEVLPKEEPELGEVKEEPGEEEQKTEEVVKEEAPDDEINAGAAGAPAVDTVADAAPDDIDTGAAEAPDVDCVAAGDDSGAGPEEPEDAELEAAEDPEGGTDVPIDVDEEEAVHSSPAPEAAVEFVHSPASPDFSERAFSEPPERPQPEGRLRTRPRILRPPSDLPPGTYPTVRLDRQGLWILVSPNPGLPATSGVRDAEQLDAPDPTEGAAATTEHIDPYELSQEQWVDLASVFAKAPASIDLSAAPVVSSRRGERTVEGFRAGVGAFAKGEVVEAEARSPSPARSRSPRATAGGAAPSAPSKATSIPAPPAKAPIPKPPPSDLRTDIPPPPPLPVPPPARTPPITAPPSKAPPVPPPQWAKEQAARREAEAKAKEGGSSAAASRPDPDQGAHPEGAADRSRSPAKPPHKAPPSRLLVSKPAPTVFKPAPTPRLAADQERALQAKAKAQAREQEAQRAREEAAAKASVPAAPRLVGQRPTLSVVFDWHKTLDLGYDRNGVWYPRVVSLLGDIFRNHRPLVFRVLSFTGRGQAQAHREEAERLLPALEAASGATFSSYDQCFERTGNGGKAQLLHHLGPIGGQPPGAHYIVDDNKEIVKESRRTGCTAILVGPPGRGRYTEEHLVDALQALNESLANLPENRASATGASELRESQFLEVLHR